MMNCRRLQSDTAAAEPEGRGKRHVPHFSTVFTFVLSAFYPGLPVVPVRLQILK